MAWVSVFFLALVPFLSVTDALGPCKYALINRVYKQTQLSNAASSYLEGATVWMPLMIKIDSGDIASRKYTFGQVTGSSLTATISTLSTDGTNSSTTATFTASSTTSFTIAESDGTTSEAYAFKCSDNLMGFFRCKAGNSKLAQFFALARTSESSTEIASEIATCTKRMKNIDSYANPVQLAHPYE